MACLERRGEGKREEGSRTAPSRHCVKPFCLIYQNSSLTIQPYLPSKFRFHLASTLEIRHPYQCVVKLQDMDRKDMGGDARHVARKIISEIPSLSTIPAWRPSQSSSLLKLLYNNKSHKMRPSGPGLISLKAKPTQTPAQKK